MEIVIEKLLHVTKDAVPKVIFSDQTSFLAMFLPYVWCLNVLVYVQVSNEAEHCLTVVLSQYDPFRCLSVCVFDISLSYIWISLALIFNISSLYCEN